MLRKIRRDLETKGLPVVGEDLDRPWGGFLILDEAHIDVFLREYFKESGITRSVEAKMSPKILMAAPAKRLSWQYHHRRGEHWAVLSGKAAVIRSNTDEQDPPTFLTRGEMISLNPLERHRLVGLEEWGVVAEIWEHTDPDNPSDEEDIVRVEDDFGR